MTSELEKLLAEAEREFSGLSDQFLYMHSAEVHAAVHAVMNIALTCHASPDRLADALIKFFANYDRMRTNQVESLKTQLVEALQWSVKPMKSGVVVPSEEPTK